MKIIVTLTNKIQCTDYQLNNDMIIKDALKIIEENDSFNLPDNLQYIYSSRSKRKSVYIIHLNKLRFIREILY